MAPDLPPHLRLSRHLPPRPVLVDVAIAAYFVALFAAPVSLTPVLAGATGQPYEAALRDVALVVTVLYVAGLLVLAHHK